MPAATVSAIRASAASVPTRRATTGASGEPSAMQITGSVVSTPAAAADRGTASRSSSSSGGTLAIAVRRFSAVSTTAAAVRRRWRGYALAGDKPNSLRYPEEELEWPP